MNSIKQTVCVSKHILSIKQLDIADKFTSVINQLYNDAGVNLSKNEVITVISTTLSDIKIFPYLLLNHEQQISLSNLGLNHHLINMLCTVTSVHQELFKSSILQFKNIISKLFQHKPITIAIIRAFFITFCFSNYLTGFQFSHEFMILITWIDQIPNEIHQLLFFEFTQYPNLLSYALSIAQTNLTSYSLNLIKAAEGQRGICPEYVHCQVNQRTTLFIQNLRVAADNSDSHFTSLPFINNAFTSLLNPQQVLIDFLCKNRIWSFLNTSAVFSLPFKQIVLQTFCSVKQSVQHHTLNLNISRNNLFNTTFNEIQKFTDDELLQKLMIKFEGEDGIDAGGVSREFFHLFCMKTFSNDSGLFKPVTDGKYWFRTDTVHNLEHFKFLGTIIALALYNSIVLPIHFPFVLYKKLLGKKLLLSDLNDIDEEIITSFHSLRKMRDQGEDIRDCSLTFSIPLERRDRPPVIHSLKTDGQSIIVTNDTLDEYINLYSDYLMNKAIEPQFIHFKQGFDRISMNQIVEIFTFDQMDILMSGKDVMNWKEVRANVKYINGYTDKSICIEWFWGIFDELSDDQKRRLLRFVTGTDRLIVDNVSFTIQRIEDSGRLPVAHTCLKVLSLPNYRSKAQLKKNIFITLENTDGFELI
jgi:ubiquitin-protein ligase E3 A